MAASQYRFAEKWIPANQDLSRLKRVLNFAERYINAKFEMVEALAATNDFPLIVTIRIIDEIMYPMSDTLIEDCRNEICGFGNFENR